MDELEKQLDAINARKTIVVSAPRPVTKVATPVRIVHPLVAEAPIIQVARPIVPAAPRVIIHPAEEHPFTPATIIPKITTQPTIVNDSPLAPVVPIIHPPIKAAPVVTTISPAVAAPVAPVAVPVASVTVVSNPDTEMLFAYEVVRHGARAPLK